MNDADFDGYLEEVIRRMWSELHPLAAAIEDDEHIDNDVLFPKLREIGAFGWLVPAEYGGNGLTITQYLPVIAEVAKIHGGIRALVHVHNSFAHAVADHATEAQRQELLPSVAVGERSIAFALTEPDHGTGLDLGTTAVSDGDGYRINGRKWLITNSDFASHFIVLGKTTNGDGGQELTAILVPRDAPGLTIERLPETMGCKGGQHGLLTFTDVWAGRDQILGGVEGRGRHHLESSLEISRVLVAASSLGTAERALELALAHAQSRVTFGAPLAERQAVQRYLAEMATDIHALRLLLADAAGKWDARQRIPGEASIVKLFGLEAVGRVTDRALLVLGGIGYTRRHEVERLYRDARLNWIEEGTPTIQHLTIARALLRDELAMGGRVELAGGVA